VDYKKKKFALMAQIKTIRIMVVISNLKGWIIRQLDVKFAFLNGPKKEEIYVS